MKVFDKWSQIGEPKTVALLEVWNELQHNKALPQDAHFCCMTDTGKQKNWDRTNQMRIILLERGTPQTLLEE